MRDTEAAPTLYRRTRASVDPSNVRREAEEGNNSVLLGQNVW